MKTTTVTVNAALLDSVEKSAHSLLHYLDSPDFIAKSEQPDMVGVALRSAMESDMQARAVLLDWVARCREKMEAR